MYLNVLCNHLFSNTRYSSLNNKIKIKIKIKILFSKQQDQDQDTLL